MTVKAIYLLILLFCIKSLGQKQCLRNEKLSKITNECIYNYTCDGYMFQDSRVCYEKNQSIIAIEYGQPSISCRHKGGIDTIYECRNCTDPSQPFGMDCTGCNQDEYLYSVNSSLRCIKKQDLGSQQFPYGFISQDLKAIILKCDSNQIVTDYNFSQKLVLKRCVSCSQDQLMSSDGFDCVSYCNPGEIKDLRSFKKCIKWQSCDLLSSDALSCVAKCESVEYISQISSLKICKKCSGIKPYLSLDKTQCVSDCGSGNVYSEEQQKCILLSDCTDFVNKGVCSKNDCTINTSPRKKPDAVLINSPQGAKYKLCIECPESIPFATKTNPLVCGDCSTQPDTRSSNDPSKKFPLIVFISRNTTKCDSPILRPLLPANVIPQKYFFEPMNGILSYDEKVVNLKSLFYESLCPPGQIAIKNQKNEPVASYKCSPCPNKEYNSQSSQNKCCLNGEFFHRSKMECVSECGLIASDFTCLPMYGGILQNVFPSCNNDEIAKQVEYVYKDQNQKDAKKMINQCISCNDLRVKLSDFSNSNSSWLSQKDLWTCYLLFLSTQSQTQAIPFANKVSTPCPPFQANQGQTAQFYQYDSSRGQSSCVYCPVDKPFLETSTEYNTQGQLIVCTRCMDKIRDYGTGICYQKIEDIPNYILGGGIFSGQRMNFWPKKFAEKSGCQNSYVTFEYKQMILKECPPVINKMCDDTNKIFDEREQKCIFPEMCSSILSSDRKKCSLEKCKSNEIYVEFSKLDPSFFTKTNNGYLNQCQVCSQDKPFIFNNSCVALCPDNYAYIQSTKKCILKDSCQNYLSNSLKICIEECGKNEIIRYEQVQYQQNAQIRICVPCLSDTPLIFNNQCVKVCPPSTYLNEYLQCIDMSTCQGVANKLNGNVCLKECPPNQYQMPIIQGDTKYSFCADQCRERYYIQQKTCINYIQCQNSIFNKQCVEKCPNGYGKLQTFDRELKNYCSKCSDQKDQQLFGQNGECKTECSDNQIGDQSTSMCIDTNMCKNFVSADNKFCLKECPPGQIPTYSESLSLTFCTICPKDKPFSDFEGDTLVCREKCRILDLTSSTNKCMKNFSDCINNIILENDVSYTCQTYCPSYGSSKIETVCNEKGQQCYSKCKMCPKNQFSNNGECVDQCPNSLIGMPDIGSCIQTCEESNQSYIYSLESKRCLSMFEYWRSNNWFIFPSNKAVTKNCPKDKVVDFLGSQPYCVLKIEDCKLPLQLLDLKKCKSPVIYVINGEVQTFIQDLTYPKFNNLYISGPEKCQGVISSDKTKCLFYCDSKEIIKKHETGDYLICTKCTGIWQNNKDTNQLECCENNTCLPAASTEEKTINPYYSIETKIENDQKVKALDEYYKLQNKSNTQQQDTDKSNLSKIEIAIICVCSIALFVCLVVGIIWIFKRFKKTNLKPNNKQKYAVAAISSLTAIKDEEIQPNLQ